MIGRATTVAIVAALVVACGGLTSGPTARAPTSGCPSAPASPSQPAAQSTSTSATSPSASASIGPGATPVLSGPFVTAGMAAQVDASAHAADPCTFTNHFPATSDTIYVVFALRTGTTGTVTMDMTREDGSSILESPLSIDYGTINSWGHFDVSLNGKGHLGIYQAVLIYVLTGDRVVIPFALE